MVIVEQKAFKCTGAAWVTFIDEDREAVVVPEDGRVLIQFRNGDVHTRVAVTDEAAWALFCSLGGWFESRAAKTGGAGE